MNLIIYNSPFNKTFKINRHSTITFKKQKKHKQYDLENNSNQCFNSLYDYNPVIELSQENNQSFIKHKLEGFILEYYMYDILQIPDKLKKIPRDELLFYPEVFADDFCKKQQLSRSRSSYYDFPSTMIQDYIERYLPEKYLTYNETEEYKIKHSNVQYNIPVNVYLNFSPKEFLEYLQNTFSIKSEKKSFLEQTEGLLEICEQEVK